MILDASLLRRACTANVERLARALGVRLPPAQPRNSYHARLVAVVANKIRRDEMAENLRRLMARKAGS